MEHQSSKSWNIPNHQNKTKQVWKKTGHHIMRRLMRESLMHLDDPEDDMYIPQLGDTPSTWQYEDGMFPRLPLTSYREFIRNKEADTLKPWNKKKNASVHYKRSRRNRLVFVKNE